MILIGTMNLTRTRERGQFYCPTCASNQEYLLRARRPFLTLYFIPVVPVGGAELFVYCRGCREKWDPSMLEMDEQVHQEIQDQQFRDEALRSAVLVVLEDGLISEREIAALQTVSLHLLERPADREELGELCAIATDNKVQTRNYVISVSRRWNKMQKIKALQAMFLAASAEGQLGASQVKLLSQMREILNLSEQEYEFAIEEALEWESV